MAVLEVENLKYRYPHTQAFALDGLTFSVEKGEFIGIIGENGAGKSTLSQAFLGLVPQFFKGAYGGKVRIDGMEADKTPTAELCRKVGLVFQNPFNQLSGAKDTVYGEIAFGLENLGIPRPEMQKRIEEVMKLLEIWEYRERNPFDLSGGQMQRVAIASILVMQPEILVLDEPTSQLDPEGSEEVFRAVDQLSEAGYTIVMIEQKIEKLAAYCDRILLLHQGKQVAFDTPEKIFARDGLAELGIQEPAFTRICKAVDLRLEDGTFPVTVEDAAEVLAAFRDLRAAKEEAVQAQQAYRSAGKVHHCPMPRELFRMEHLDFSYIEGTPILQGLSEELDSRPTAIIGQNGAGKTTLVKLLKGLLKPVGGAVYYKQEDIAGKTVAMLAPEVGYVFQNPDDQIFKYHVLDEVMFGPVNIGMTEAQAKEKALEALAMTGLSELASENPYDLELSQRKMVAIASVLAMDTDVIILDEPTIAQDWKGRERIKEIIWKLSEQGKLVLAILHDMDFVAECFERVIVMAQGKVLADGTPREVFCRNEILAGARLTLPHVTELCRRLGYEGVYLTVEDFLEQA